MTKPTQEQIERVAEAIEGRTYSDTKDAIADILESYDSELATEVERLREAMQKTINENLHLADGDVCTLIHIKKALAGEGK